MRWRRAYASLADPHALHYLLKAATGGRTLDGIIRRAFAYSHDDGVCYRTHILPPPGVTKRRSGD